MKLDTGKRYSFEIYPSTLVPTDFKKVKILIKGMTADVARGFDDIDSAHARYLPTLPPNTPVNPNDFQYIYVQLATGQKVVVSEAWIKEETIQVVEGVRIVAVVEDQSIDAVRVIQQMFATNGYNAVITVE